MAIGQASGVPKGREEAARYLHAFIEEAKAGGFVANALAASGQNASVAPAEDGPR
jgi:polar amino acid transport system substrate-binding protein